MALAESAHCAAGERAADRARYPHRSTHSRAVQSGRDRSARRETPRAGAIARLEEVQIDCDTPDRLLGSYARALGEIRRLVPRLTVTALAGWSRTPHWESLQQNVDEIFPMFYDLEVDPPGVGSGAAPRPFIERDVVAAQLRDWSKCRIPWRAGLPNFARLTLYNTAGKSRGHIRQWRWNDVSFNAGLVDANIKAGAETSFCAPSVRRKSPGHRSTRTS
jgi:hypothetical protein